MSAVFVPADQSAAVSHQLAEEQHIPTTTTIIILNRSTAPLICTFLDLLTD